MNRIEWREWSGGCSETRLDIIDLSNWLEALDYGFIRFLKESDAELRRLYALRVN